MGKEQSFEQMVLGQLDSHKQQNGAEPLKSYTKVNSEWIKT